MSSTIQFSGLGSGLPTSDWVNALIQAESLPLNNLQTKESKVKTSQSTLSAVASDFSALRSALEKITDASLASSLDLFKKTKVTSSDADKASATATSKASTQKIDLKIESLATATTAKSTTATGQVIDGSETFTDLGSGTATAGTFSFYTNGVRHTFTIGEGDTLNNIADTINNAGISGVQADVNSGKFEIKIDDSQISSFQIGSSADTSNFFNVMHLSNAPQQDITQDPFNKMYASTADVSKVNAEGTIIGNTANLAGSFTAGTYKFKLGGDEFTINSDTTLQGLINNINSSDTAGVIASYDANENKLVLTSKTPGKTAISMEDTSGDFLQQMNLITAGGDSLSSQTLGDNAKVYINGSTTATEVNSNTLTGDVSGLTGVTISLNDVTDAGKNISLNVQQNTDDLVSAVSDFVDKFNAAINDVNGQTAHGSNLSGEYTLVSLKNSLRTMVTNRVDGLSNYDSLSMIGITSGVVGTKVSANTKTLQFDQSQLIDALQKNPAEVKALLVGDSANGISGILQQLGTSVANMTDPVSGYFASRDDSYNSQIATLDKSITDTQGRLDKRKTQLETQFNQMDQYISQLQQSSSSLSSLLK